MNRVILKIEVQAQKRSFILNSPCLLSGLRPLLQSRDCFRSGEGPEKKYHELRNRFFDLVQTDRKKRCQGKCKRKVTYCSNYLWPRIIIPRSATAKLNVWQVALKRGFSFPTPLSWAESGCGVKCLHVFLYERNELSGTYPCFLFPSMKDVWRWSL